MNKEVKETIKILQNNSLVKSGYYEFIGDSDITYAEIYILLKFIEDLQQENKQIKIQISAREEVCYRLEEENKKYKEVIDKIMNLIKQYGKYDGKKCTRGFQMWSADFNKILDILKEVE